MPNGPLPLMSPLGAAIAATPQFAAAAGPQQSGSPEGAHPLLDALIAFLNSPVGQQIEAALIQMIISLISKTR